MRHKLIILGLALCSLLVPFQGEGRACGVAVSLLKRVEGFCPSVYVCQNGEQAIGYGFTDQLLISRHVISKAEADAELSRRCGALVRMIRKDMKGQGLTDNQIAAIVSFAYNVGWGNYKRSRVRRLIMDGRRGIEVAEEIRKWVFFTRDGKKIRSRGLQKRRVIEAVVFSS